MFLNRLEDHAGVILVILVVGIGTAIIAGNGIVAAVVSIGVALLAFSLIARKDKRTSQPSDLPQRDSGTEITFNFAWIVSKPPERSVLEGVLMEHGLKVDQDASSESTMVFRGGSQLRTRLLGGYFIAPSHLPLRAEVNLLAGEPGAAKVELRIR